MDPNADLQSLAVTITRSASRQTYYTIRFLVDRDRVDDAYRAYAYFRWVDDILDAQAGTRSEKIAFASRQQSLLEASYRGQVPDELCAEERLLVDLVFADTRPNSGLQIYLRNMMAVMSFDAHRRGQVIDQAQLADYSHKLAVAVTEAMYYFIGHDSPPPVSPARYLAVTAAHITHMLRDACEDTAAGYYNLPGEYLRASGIAPDEVTSQAYRRWVCSRVQLARKNFKAGREFLAQVKNWRCRLAGYAYMARFEWMLRAIEGDHYCLRTAYPERKGLWAGVWMGWSALASLFVVPRIKAGPASLAVQPVRMDEK